MRIKRLYLGDFGIFRNEKIDNISPGIVIIGGLNRAGKSTFMEILRHLAYGFGKGESIPDANIHYKIEGDVINELNEEFNICIDGFSEPRVNPINNSKKTTSLELYNNLDAHSYKQLFTISLDELRKLNSKDEGKIQSILLGAGLNEIVEIPKIVGNLKKEAEKIGGKIGNPTSKMFKPFNQRIINATKRRNDEIKNLDRYMELSSELKAMEKSITDSEKALRNLENKIVLIDILKNNYCIYAEKKELELKLNELKHRKNNKSSSEGYSIEKLEEIRNEFIDKTKLYDEGMNYFKLSDYDKFSLYNKLIEFEEIITYYERKMSGLQEKIKNYFISEKSYEDDKQNIIVEMKKINDGWNDNFITVLDIRTDILSSDDLNKLCLEYEILQDDMKDLKTSIENMGFQKNIIEKKLTSTGNIKKTVFSISYLYISLSIILIGIIIIFINKTAGTGLTLIGGICTALYILAAYNSWSNNGDKKKELLIEIEEIASKQEIELDKLQKLKEKHSELNAGLTHFRKALGLKGDISTDGLKDYFRSIQDIKSKILILGSSGRKLETVHNEIIEELKNIHNIILEFPELVPQKNDIIDSRPNIKDYNDELKAIGNLISYLKTAKDIKEREHEKILIENKIKGILPDEYQAVDLLEALKKYIEAMKLNKEIKNLEVNIITLEERLKQPFETNRVKTALRTLREQTNECNDIISELYSTYPNQVFIESEYESLNNEYEIKKEQLELFKEKGLSIKDNLVRLSTIKNLEDAQRDLDEARGELRSYAEKFAIQSTAAFILESVQKSFINKVKNHLFDDASGILKVITDGEFKGIIPTEDLIKLDYKSVLMDGTINDSVDYLSRGTGEQIFLSVRLGRLRDIKPSLPVIFDDCFVNFDNIHVKNTIGIINELGKINQVFILTCHPQLIKCLVDHEVNAQCWKLEKGNFSLTNSENLYKYLLNG